LSFTRKDTPPFSRLQSTTFDHISDYSTERVLRSLVSPDLLILDDFALRRFNATQSSDIYDVIIERHRRSSTIFTSNRDIHEMVALFDDPALAQSALDRLAHNAHQVVIEGESYRKRQGPANRNEHPRP